jgi:Tfp pilus assembly protein PilZ
MHVEAAPHARPQPAPVPSGSVAQDRAGGTGGPVIRIEADLGAHSSSNFYKGLSGHDVIDSGGIFVATYQVPALGQNVLLKVSLPGGYEFEARGVVRWTRDAGAASADAPPGFGAQLTDISPEGRQLVYRYVRNREPLFHDDL